MDQPVVLASEGCAGNNCPEITFTGGMIEVNGPEAGPGDGPGEVKSRLSPALLLEAADEYRRRFLT
jgi:hypothetical protein